MEELNSQRWWEGDLNASTHPVHIWNIFETSTDNHNGLACEPEIEAMEDTRVSTNHSMYILK